MSEPYCPEAKYENCGWKDEALRLRKEAMTDDTSPPQFPDSGQRFKAWIYFGTDANVLERYVQDLIDRGGKIISASIAYGPSPAKVARMMHADESDTWHALVVVDTKELRDE